MTIIDLKEDIVKQKLKHFYIFVGEEIGIINIYLKEMSNKLQLSIKRTASLASVYSQLGDNLFGDNEGFYVIRDDRDFIKADGVFDTVEADLGRNYVVMLYDKLDSRLKVCKAFKDNLVVFEKLSTDILVNYIKKSCTLDTRHAELLAAVTGNSYDVCLLECDKIRRYAECLNISHNEALDVLLREGAIFQQEDSSVFNFSDMVLSKRFNEAIHISQILRGNGVDAIGMLGTLYASMKNVLLVQVCENDDVPGTTGLDSRQVYYAKKYVGKYNSLKLVEGLALIANTIDSIKVGGIDEMYAVPYVIVQLC